MQGRAQCEQLAEHPRVPMSLAYCQPRAASTHRASSPIERLVFATAHSKTLPYYRLGLWRDALSCHRTQRHYCPLLKSAPFAPPLVTRYRQSLQCCRERWQAASSGMAQQASKMKQPVGEAKGV
eukprot:scaffold105761_cov31-Tisochrysis_lutea.AAC.2